MLEKSEEKVWATVTSTYHATRSRGQLQALVDSTVTVTLYTAPAKVC
jgi:hypothetical protein